MLRQPQLQLETKDDKPKQFMDELREINSSGARRFIEEVSELIRNWSYPAVKSNKEILILRSKILRLIGLARYTPRSVNPFILAQAEQLENRIIPDAIRDFAEIINQIKKDLPNSSYLPTEDVLLLEMWYTAQVFQRGQRNLNTAIKFIYSTILREPPLYEQELEAIEAIKAVEAIDDWIHQRNDAVNNLWQEGLQKLQKLNQTLRAKRLIELYSLCEKALKNPEKTKPLDQQVLDRQPFDAFFTAQATLAQSPNNTKLQEAPFTFHAKNHFIRNHPKGQCSYDELASYHRILEFELSSLLKRRNRDELAGAIQAHCDEIAQVELSLKNIEEARRQKETQLVSQIEAFAAQAHELVTLIYPTACSEKDAALTEITRCKKLTKREVLDVRPSEQDPNPMRIIMELVEHYQRIYAKKISPSAHALLRETATSVKDFDDKSSQIDEMVKEGNYQGIDALITELKLRKTLNEEKTSPTTKKTWFGFLSNKKPEPEPAPTAPTSRQQVNTAEQPRRKSS